MIDLEMLGLTKEELQARVIDGICSRLLEEIVPDSEDGERQQATRLENQLEKIIKERTDEAVATIADKYIIPNATQYLETLCLQETNKWGEKRGEKLSFIEYLVKRAEAYLTEEVNYEGKIKGQNSYSWSKSGTRVSYLVNQHLQYSIETAMKQAVAGANQVIVGGLEQAVKIKLEEVAQKLKVEVKTR